MRPADGSANPTFSSTPPAVIAPSTSNFIGRWTWPTRPVRAIPRSSRISHRRALRRHVRISTSTPGGTRETCYNSPTTSGCWSRWAWLPRTADSQGSSAPTDWWSGTTSTRRSGRHRRCRRSPSCAAPWSAMTSSSTFGSTSSLWPDSINSTPLSIFSSSQFVARSARTVRGPNTAARSSKLRRVT